MGDSALISYAVGGSIAIAVLLVVAHAVRWLLSGAERDLDSQVREAHRSGDLRRAGDLQARRGKYEEAARLYAQGKEWGRQARALLKAGDTRGAAEAFAKAGEDEEAARCFEEIGDHARAAQHKQHGQSPRARLSAAEQFLKTDPLRAAKLFQESGEFERAAEAYARVPALEPADLVVTMLENAALAMDDDATRRRALLERAGDAAYKLGLHDRAARALDGAGALARAAQLYERALKRFDLAAALYAEVGDKDGLRRATDAAGGEIEVLRARENRARERGDNELSRKLRARIRELETEKRPTLPPTATRDDDTGNVTVPAVSPRVMAQAKGKSAKASLNEAGSRYELLDELGRGGMGVVFRAHDRLLGRVVALKFLPDDIPADSAVGQLFRREARAAAALSHPGIVTIFDVGRHEGREFIAMELVDGKPLDKLLQERGKLAVLEGLEVAEAVASALSYAHEHGIVHRDIKPANLMRLKNGGIKVMDFGLAKSVRASTGQGGPTLIAGTPAYMPPEQLKGVTDARSDVFALGATLYELFTGRLPGTPTEAAATASRYPSPRELEPLVPERWSATIMKCMAHDPLRRPQHVDEVLDDARRVKSGIVDALRALAEAGDEAAEQARSVPIARPKLVRRGEGEAGPPPDVVFSPRRPRR